MLKDRFAGVVPDVLDAVSHPVLEPVVSAE
jgi:hypothetical protein